MGVPVSSPRSAKVIDLSVMRDRMRARRRILRLAPEHDGLEMLYQLDSDPDSYYSLPVLAWGLREDGEVVGMVPWMEGLMPCHELEDPQQGHFVGYRDPETDEVFMLAPDHKVFELEHAAAYYDYEVSDKTTLLQQLPDTLGTHALCMTNGETQWQLKQVFGWRLYSDGNIEALLVDEARVTQTPVLAGDDCLYPGRSRHDVVYFFQRAIANQIREQDPATLEALALMMTGESDQVCVEVHDREA